ncbi:hypothetical protein QIA34_00490 (plasmid) [Borreliella yangtzensis]|uniref:Lipoprotein n=1 Tax=Borreliella yangtzensis TaxID=683292 RepID=A0ABR6PC02_9SPIR|nr:hypothetical protein [Borreliella yangtzensis]MBB6043284.1 hypothetical protein [Borreliella yangtzensis]WKC72992.1 hypothetical protein QIA35_00495 [Borreliella yangtzensis]WKC73911.1 hypothetical protein QIA34_00490 [Borreliella yangtzensis]
MKRTLRKFSNKFLVLASWLLIISCNANMNANDKNKALNEHKLTNISEVIKNSFQIELDFKKELEANTNQNTPPILEIEKIEPGKQEFLLKSESGGESLMPIETPEETNMAKSEEEIAKIQEKLLLIGASDEITEQALDPNMQKSLHPTTIEFKISRTPDGQTILNPIDPIEKEEINTNMEGKFFDPKEENNPLKENTKTQNQFQNQKIYLSKGENFIAKEYAEEVRKSLDKALNAIKNLEKSKEIEFEFEIEIENLSKALGNSANTTDSLTVNNNNIEKTKNKLLEDLEKSELIFEEIKDPLGTSTIKQVIDAAINWKEKENLSQINWDLGSKFHPNPKLYNKQVAQIYKALAEKFTKVKNEYKNTKEQLKVQPKLTTANIKKIIDASKEFATQVKNLILLVEDNNNNPITINPKVVVNY